MKYGKYVPGHGHYAPHVLEAKREGGKASAKPVGTTSTRKGSAYRMVKCADGEWRYEHRVVAGIEDGDPRHVHHINGNPLDNQPENLEVIEHGEHTRIHCSISAWARLFDRCKECGENHRKHCGQGLCSACYQRQWRRLA